MADDSCVENDDCFMKESLCYDCCYRLSKEIRPLASAIEEWEEDLGIEIDGSTVIEVHCCILTQIDLDHIVAKCNKYLSNTKTDFIANINRLKR